MRAKIPLLFVCGLVVGLIAAWLCLRFVQPDRLHLSVQFLGYTNIPAEEFPLMHGGVLLVSNASPFVVVRSRSPEVVFDSATVPVENAPNGWSMLGPGQTEQVKTESLTNGLRWRFVVRGERLGDDSYGIGEEPKFRVWRTKLAFWLQGRGIRVATPEPPPARVFSTAWIDP